MMTFLQKCFSKALAVAILGAVLIALFGLVADPLMTRFTGVRDRITDERQLLGRLQSALDPKSSGQEVSKPEALNAAAFFLPGTSDSLRLAGLQSRIGEVTTGVGVVIKSVKTLPAREREKVRLVGLEAQFTGSIAQVQRILFKLETEQPFLFIEALQISAPALLSEDNPQAGDQLDVRLGVLGAVAGKKG